MRHTHVLRGYVITAREVREYNLSVLLCHTASSGLLFT